ncbi:MAG: SNO glutamine amidotransferase family-domain-containing protein, partial [Olpidium bornovanus]
GRPGCLAALAVPLGAQTTPPPFDPSVVFALRPEAPRTQSSNGPEAERPHFTLAGGAARRPFPFRAGRARGFFRDENPSPSGNYVALQGDFVEHINLLKAIPDLVAAAVPVRTPEQLLNVDALIIPGGESTSMAITAEQTGMLEPLREFVRTKPTWVSFDGKKTNNACGFLPSDPEQGEQKGTCAGMILLSNAAERMKQGGQKLLGGLDVVVRRNQFGSQLASFEAPLHIEGFSDPFMAVFIRAPVVCEVKSDAVQVLARLETHKVDVDGNDELGAVVAVRQGHLLATAFHPELTHDDRMHRLFLGIVRETGLLEELASA